MGLGECCLLSFLHLPNPVTLKILDCSPCTDGEQMNEVFDALDIDLIINSCLDYQTLEEQTDCALAQIEHQMILDGLYITEPYRFNLPS